MKIKPSTLFWTFVWCIFMGITVGSIGIGAAFPSANLIAKPFVCPAGRMELTTQDYTVSPVESGTVLTWYCVDGKTGVKTELGIFPMALYAGAIYGFVLFLVVLLGMQINAYRKYMKQTSGWQPAAAVEAPYSGDRSAPRKGEADDSTGRMRELKKLRASNLISAEEYERKRAEILKEI